MASSSAKRQKLDPRGDGAGYVAHFAAHGWCIVPGLLSGPNVLESLRMEAQLLLGGGSKDDNDDDAASWDHLSTEQGCVLDWFEDPSVLDAAARTSLAAYLSARRRQRLRRRRRRRRQDGIHDFDDSDDCDEGDDHDDAVVSHAVTTTLANVAGAVLRGWPDASSEAAEQDMNRRHSSESCRRPPLSPPPAAAAAAPAAAAAYLFNEHYVVKPPRNKVEFRWHQDAVEQLSMCVAPPCGHYVSAWAALDDAGAFNGGLCVDGRGGWRGACGGGAAIGASEATRKTSTAGGPCGGDKEGGGGAGGGGGGIQLDVAAGDVVFFASNLWHRSGPNPSPAPRRAFYAQYSLRPIKDSPKAAEPLRLAVPCPGRKA